MAEGVGFEPTGPRRVRRFSRPLPDADATDDTTDSANSCDADGQSPESVLAECLLFLAQRMPDLATVVKAWPDLPDAVKAGILAMVKVAGEGG